MRKYFNYRRLFKKNKRNRNQKGFGTVEIVLIIAVLISLALLFRSAITSYATSLMVSVFGDQSVLTESVEED
jgi:competence protein ComGC